MRRRIALVALIASIAIFVSACGHDSPAQRPQAAMGVDLHGDFTGTGPGTLLDARTLPTIDRRLTVFTSIAGRVKYTSTSAITNTDTQVTGTVFAPKGTAPDGGWPIVALAHATSGIETDCAPSLSPSLEGLVSTVALLLQAGYVVTVTDYQGLGSDQTYHPYLEPKTEGYNVIDAVRAARKLVPDTSDHWLAVGFSQGGQAAWAANELSADYGQGLTLLGSVSLAPPLDLTFLADLAAAGTLSNEQKPAYQEILASLKNEYPDFNLDDYRRGIVQQDWDTLLHCDVIRADARSKTIDEITENDLRPSSQAAIDILRAYLEKMSLPQKVASAPMLVIYGGKDAYVPAESTERALAEACHLGDVIEIRFQPEKGHADLDIGATVRWITDRTKGAPIIDNCIPAPPPQAPPEGGATPPGGAANATG